MVTVSKTAFNLQIIIKPRLHLKFYESAWAANHKTVNQSTIKCESIEKNQESIFNKTN